MAYTVIRQVPDTYDFTVPGDPVLGVQIYFTTAAGNQGSVFIPESKYTAVNASNMIGSKAKLIDEVGALGTEHG
jgi:hypothetical protein